MKTKKKKQKKRCSDCGCPVKTFSELCLCTCHNYVAYYTKSGKYVRKLMACLPEPKKKR